MPPKKGKTAAAKKAVTKGAAAGKKKAGAAAAPPANAAAGSPSLVITHRGGWCVGRSKKVISELEKALPSVAVRTVMEKGSGKFEVNADLGGKKGKLYHSKLAGSGYLDGPKDHEKLDALIATLKAEQK